jgi:hypothetical protein
MPRFVLELDPRAKEYAVSIVGGSIDDRHSLKAFAQESYATVDLPQSTFAIGVFGVFGAVALCSGFADSLSDLWSLDSPQLVELGGQPRVTFLGDEFGAGGRRRSVAGHGD